MGASSRLPWAQLCMEDALTVEVTIVGDVPTDYLCLSLGASSTDLPGFDNLEPVCTTNQPFLAGFGLRVVPCFVAMLLQVPTCRSARASRWTSR